MIKKNVSADNFCKTFVTLMVFWKEFFKKVDFEKNQQTKKHEESSSRFIKKCHTHKSQSTPCDQNTDKQIHAHKTKYN